LATSEGVRLNWKRFLAFPAIRAVCVRYVGCN
jgi:hypothetical protein